MFKVLPESKGRRLYVRASGTLTDDDYKELMPRMEKAIDEFGRLRLFVDMQDLEGWEIKAAFDDFAFGLKHWNDFERVAMVGNQRWEEISAKVFDALSAGEVRFFDAAHRDTAHDWIKHA
ncbi:MAG: STAS/SEC14 domain-containing protein [Rhodospirillales bacterium]|nr:STAS/SEC14 domain-containing protein [Rhodospirillales bacterium]